MAEFTFTAPDGKTFTIKGPESLTRDQAQAIFDKQQSTGALVGLASGTILSAPTSDLSGLSRLQNAILPKGGFYFPGSTSTKSIETITKTIADYPVTNPINTADFTKVASSITGSGAVSGIAAMSIPEVNGVLAQAKNLVGQASSVISNSKGVGSFGFDVKQLETAGYVKPGTNALMAAAGSVLSDVVKSPAAWTGKDGIKGVGDLLGSDTKQSLIQQDLMTKGVAGLAAVGIPVAGLSSQGIAGMALNAAKSLPSAEAFAKGLPIPGDATGAIQSAFSSAVRDGAYAVNLVADKIPTIFKEQDVPIPKIDTVNRATLDAAVTRIVGDPKIPIPKYTAG